jgi:hypothetical protein
MTSTVCQGLGAMCRFFGGRNNVSGVLDKDFGVFQRSENPRSALFAVAIPDSILKAHDKHVR